MGERVGIVAGSGAYVGRILSELEARGMSCVVVGVEGEADRQLESRAASFQWVKPGELGRAVGFLKEEGVQAVWLVGRLKPTVLLGTDHFDEAAKLIWAKAKPRSPARLLRAVIDFFEESGLLVRSPLDFLEPFFCREGVLTSWRPSGDLIEEMDFGLELASRLADLEVGQTVVVKAGVVVAVEGLEGTDRAILRAGELAGPGTVVAKAGRSVQEMRIDVPGVGLETIKTLIQARARALAIEADKVAFFEREEAIALAEAQGIPIAARRVPQGGE